MADWRGVKGVQMTPEQSLDADETVARASALVTRRIKDYMLIIEGMEEARELIQSEFDRWIDHRSPAPVPEPPGDPMDAFVAEARHFDRHDSSVGHYVDQMLTDGPPQGVWGEHDPANPANEGPFADAAALEEAARQSISPMLISEDGSGVPGGVNLDDLSSYTLPVDETEPEGETDDDAPPAP